MMRSSESTFRASSKMYSKHLLSSLGLLVAITLNAAPDVAYGHKDANSSTVESERKRATAKLIVDYYNMKLEQAAAKDHADRMEDQMSIMQKNIETLQSEVEALKKSSQISAKIIDEVRNLLEDLNFPRSLADMGIPLKLTDKIIDDAYNSYLRQINSRSTSREEVIKMFEKAL